MTSIPKLWQRYRGRAPCSSQWERPAMEAGLMPALLSNPYKDASRCILAEGAKNTSPLTTAPKRAITGLPPAIHTSSRARNAESLNKARAGGDKKPIWVWDWVAKQLRGSYGKLLPGFAFLQMTRLLNPSPAGRIQSTKYGVGWVPRTARSNCLNPPLSKAKENAWAPWERAARRGQTSNLVNPMLNSAEEAHRTSPPCLCWSIPSCFPGQCCSTRSHLLGHLRGDYPVIPGPWTPLCTLVTLSSHGEWGSSCSWAAPGFQDIAEEQQTKAWEKKFILRSACPCSRDVISHSKTGSPDPDSESKVSLSLACN